MIARASSSVHAREFESDVKAANSISGAEAAQAVEKWSGHNIDSTVGHFFLYKHIYGLQTGVGFGEGAVPHPQLEKFLIFSNTKSQFSQHKIVKKFFLQ